MHFNAISRFDLSNSVLIIFLNQFILAVNVSGFQVLKLELTLTLKGFLERSRVVAAIYESIESLRSDQNSFVISREIMAVSVLTFGTTYSYLSS